jgi:DNA-binding LacI/PurR family transcriptional regulator
MTVSRALADHPKAPVKPSTRQRVQEVAAELGYCPNLQARAVATGKSNTLGLLLFEITDPFIANYAQTTIVEAHRHGYQVILELATSHCSEDLLDDQRVQIREMISRGVDGLLMHVRGDEPNRVLEAARDRAPVVVFGYQSGYPLEGVSSVVLDRAAGTCAATEHLIRLGHRRVGFVGKAWDGPLPSASKGQGYLRAAQKYGLTPERVALEDWGPDVLERSYQAGLKMGRASDRPTAFVCWSDLVAMGICRGLQEVGVRVPEDVALVGFDDIHLGAYFTPPLTTVAQPVEEICRKAMELLMEQLSGKKEVRQVAAQPRLVVRRSCGAGSRPIDWRVASGPPEAAWVADSAPHSVLAGHWSGAVRQAAGGQAE